MMDYHSGCLAGHFSGPRLYQTLARKWWWKCMYRDALEYAESCPQCAIVKGTGRKNKPPLHPIPTERPFQIVGVDIMELPVTTRGNKYVVVFQDLFTKWPMVYPTSNQKAETIARLIVEEIVPFFGVPEALLSDRGTNLLSHLMKDICKLLGIKKLNTTAHHPECDGAVERFNRTLKTMLRKQAARHGAQWDQYIHGVVWAYRNTPHSSTKEKPSYLLFGMDCRSPTEAALLPPKSIRATKISDYREELVTTLSSARALALKFNRKSQQQYKHQHDKKATTPKFCIGDWVLVYFPQDETGKDRKLSHPWHGPYRIISRDDLDVTVKKIYFPDDSQIQIHQSRVQMCPELFPQGFYWYGKRRHGPGRPSKKVQKKLTEINANLEQSLSNADSQPSEITFTETKTASTETADDNQLVNHNQLNNQSADISDDPSPVSTCEYPQGPRRTSRRAKKGKQKDIQPVNHRYNLRSRKETKSLETGLE